LPDPDAHRTRRDALLALALVLVAACLLPPLATEARRYEFAEAIQYSVLGVVVPALVALGAPWRRLGLASPSGPAEADGGAGRTTGPASPSTWAPAVSRLRAVDRLARGRRRHPEALRSACFFALYLAGSILWRMPASVNALTHHPWLLAVEAVTLVVVGTGLWLELVESPPLVPRLSRPHRVALAAVSMWAVWILAYLVGLSHASWYHAFIHHAGTGLSLSADQQLATGTMWFISGCAFVPVVFWNLVQWLQSEEDPDEELHRLLRVERIRGRTEPGGRTTA
jgi:cytochrome c oxidase assembly factor CtaG